VPKTPEESAPEPTSTWSQLYQSTIMLCLLQMLVVNDSYRFLHYLNGLLCRELRKCFCHCIYLPLFKIY